MEAALASLDLVTLQAYLSEAVVARHEILTLKRAASIRFGDRERSFNDANVSELQIYIGQLQAAIQSKAAGSPPTRRRAIYPGVGMS